MTRLTPGILSVFEPITIASYQAFYDYPTVVLVIAVTYATSHL